MIAEVRRYAWSPQVLMETARVAEHLTDPTLRVIEVFAVTAAFEERQLSGAANIP